MPFLGIKRRGIGGEGGIRTHVGQGPQQISSLRRYDRFEYLSGGAVAYVDSGPDTTRRRAFILQWPCKKNDGVHPHLALSWS